MTIKELLAEVRQCDAEVARIEEEVNESLMNQQNWRTRQRELIQRVGALIEERGQMLDFERCAIRDGEHVYVLAKPRQRLGGGDNVWDMTTLEILPIEDAD